MDRFALDRQPGPGPAAESEAGLLQLLVHAVTDYAIFALDPDGVVATWNPGAARLKGYRAEEIIGQHFSRFYTEEDLAAELPDRELAIAAAEGHFEDEGWRIRKDGTRFWANVVITALRAEDGRLVGFGKVTRDLTERKHGEDILRDSEERFRLLVSGVRDYAIFLLTPEGRIASWNLGAEKLKGYRADEIIGQHFSRFYTEEDRRDDLPGHGLRTALSEGRWESQGWRLRKDGTRFWADVVITALRDSEGRHRGFAKVTRDLTDRKRNEDALRGVLERERGVAARLRELDRMKNELVAVIAHDLQEPIGVIRGFLQLARADWATTSEAERLEILSRIADRTEVLAHLVDDVLDMARIEAGQLRIDTVPVDLEATIAQVVADAAVRAPDRVVDVDLDVNGALALGDPQRTWQVLANLVSNALKFSPEDTPVTITTEGRPGEVVVSVADRGPGIPAEQQPHLFERFSRLPHGETRPGTGIGLFIARSLAEAQQGRRWVESAPGAGSTFRLALPAAP